MTPVLLVGVGNDDRGDDGAGLEVARRLKALRLPAVTVVEATGDGAELMECWRGHSRVFVFDAVSSGAAPGVVHRLAMADRTVPTPPFRCSTHAFGLAEAIELARAMGRLPRSLVVFGIEGKRFDVGAGLSDEVRAAVAAVVERVLRDLRAPAR